MENVYLKQQCEELGLNYEALDWSSLTDAEFSALGYIRKGQAVPEELKREILTSKESKDVATRSLMAEDVFNKLVEANIVNKDVEIFEAIHTDVVKKLKFLPVENLKKLLSASYKQNSTLPQWFQKMRKEGMFDFKPYFYKENDEYVIVLAYDQYMTWSDEKNLQLVSTNGAISTDRDDMNDKMYDFIETMVWDMPERTNTELFQILFYISITNTGVISKAFRNMLSKTDGFLDEFAKSSGETHLFDDFTFKFYDLVPYLNRHYAKNVYEYSDTKTENWIWFRVPADDSDYDFCRIGIGSSLKTIMEYVHTNKEGNNQEEDSHQVIRVDFEPALNKLSYLSREEKEKILSDSNIGRAVVTFTLSLQNINITKTDVYSTAPTKTKLLSKSSENLPILHDATELDYRVFEKLSNRQKVEQARPMPAPSRPAGMPPLPTPPGNSRPAGMPPFPTPPGSSRPLGMPPLPPPAKNFGSTSFDNMGSDLHYQ